MKLARPQGLPCFLACWCIWKGPSDDRVGRKEKFPVRIVKQQTSAGRRTNRVALESQEH